MLLVNAKELLHGYDLEHLSIASFGGHSALEVCRGAKAQGFKSVVIARRDRAHVYANYSKTDGEVGCVDEVIEVDDFADILKDDVQKKLRALNALFVQSRYVWVYLPSPPVFAEQFAVPILGARHLPGLEERSAHPNQYDLLKAAGIDTPKIFSSPKHIDRLTLTKVNAKERSYERANFFAATPKEWQQAAEEKIAAGDITKEALEKAVIEEFVLGAPINMNFFYSPLRKKLELMSTDTRRQTNLEGWLRLPAKEQAALTQCGLSPMHIETGHVPATIKESLMSTGYLAAEKLRTASCETQFDETGRGIHGPFALQGAIDTTGNKERFVVFDLSLRMPGSPAGPATPYSHYLHGRSVSLGERIAMEVSHARNTHALERIIS